MVQEFVSMKLAEEGSDKFVCKYILGYAAPPDERGSISTFVMKVFILWDIFVMYKIKNTKDVMLSAMPNSMMY